jgi:hypothetical protein
MRTKPAPSRCGCGGIVRYLDNTCACGYKLARCGACGVIWAVNHKISKDFTYEYEMDLKLTKMIMVQERTKNPVEVAKQTEEYDKEATKMTPTEIKEEVKKMEKMN